MLEQTQHEILSLQQQIKIQEQKRDSNLRTLLFYTSMPAHQGVIDAYTNIVAQHITNIATLQNRIKQLQSRLQSLKNALSSPPPTTKIQSTQKVLKSIKSLQAYQKQATT